MNFIKNNKVVSAIVAIIAAGLVAFYSGVFGGETVATPTVEEKPTDSTPVSPVADPPAVEVTVTAEAPATTSTTDAAPVAAPAVVAPAVAAPAKSETK